MNISRYDAHARASAALAVGLIAFPAAMATGRSSSPPTTPGISHPATPRAAGAPELTISISDGQVAVRPGQMLSYRVSVRNTGTVTAGRLEVTQTLSAGLEVTGTSENGVARAGRVAWSTALPAGGTRTFLVTARVTRPPAQMLRLAAIACVALPGARQPIVCAAHLDKLPAAEAGKAGKGGPARRQSGMGAAPYAEAAFALLAVCVAAVLFRYRTRLRRRLPSRESAKHKAATPAASAPSAANANGSELP